MFHKGTNVFRQVLMHHLFLLKYQQYILLAFWLNVWQTSNAEGWRCHNVHGKTFKKSLIIKILRACMSGKYINVYDIGGQQFENCWTLADRHRSRVKIINRYRIWSNVKQTNRHNVIYVSTIKIDKIKIWRFLISTIINRCFGMFT